MTKLNMYETEVDFVIAESEEEAMKFLLEQGYDESDLVEMELNIMSDDQDFTLVQPDGSKEVKKISQWINEKGKGYFACTEY